MDLYKLLIIAVSVDIIATVSLCVIDIIDSRRYKRFLEKAARQKGET